MKRLVGAVVVSSAAIVGGVMAASPASSADGACTTDDGVTVIVDATAIGGSVSLRCAAQRPPSGLEALRQAGFGWSPVSSQPGMVCRIDGRPSNQSCASSPPANAYWAYFRANRGGDWRYSAVGAAAAPIAGGVEGWVFSTGSKNPPAMNPPAALARTAPIAGPTNSPTAKPKSKPTGQPGVSSPHPVASGSAHGNPAPSVAAGQSSAAASAPVQAPPAGDAIAAPPVGAVPVVADAVDPSESAGGSLATTVLALAIVGGLVAGAVVMATRRRRSS